MDFTLNFMILETAAMLVIFVLGRLIQFLLNVEKKPYVVRNVNDPGSASVYIYRIQRSGSRHMEYKFLNAGGRWKPVIDKASIIGVVAAVIIVGGILLYTKGIINTLILGLPLALYGALVASARYIEAYTVLMKE